MTVLKTERLLLVPLTRAMMERRLVNDHFDLTCPVGPTEFVVHDVLSVFSNPSVLTHSEMSLAQSQEGSRSSGEYRVDPDMESSSQRI